VYRTYEKYFARSRVHYLRARYQEVGKAKTFGLFMIKRLFDVLFSSVLLLLLLPLMVLVAFAIWIFIGRPIFFSQLRPGLGEQIFRMYKFRTMEVSVDIASEPLPDEERLTGFGLFLRRTSLDELPELINVLKGDMSLVGPRPLLVDYLPLYSSEQKRRHEVRPGITGWAQVNGRNAVSWEGRFRYDVWYVDHHNYLLDMKILLMTIVQVFRTDQVNQPDHATMEKFQGKFK
jgi:sugar transferase EpsL